MARCVSRTPGTDQPRETSGREVREIQPPAFHSLKAAFPELHHWAMNTHEDTHE